MPDHLNRNISRKDKDLGLSGQVAPQADSPTCFYRHAPPHFAGFYTVIFYYIWVNAVALLKVKNKPPEKRR